jgi:hypothetical protein
VVENGLLVTLGKNVEVDEVGRLLSVGERRKLVVLVAIERLEVELELTPARIEVTPELREETVMEGVCVYTVPVTPRIVCKLPTPTLNVPLPLSQSQAPISASAPQQNESSPQGTRSPLLCLAGSS